LRRSFFVSEIVVDTNVLVYDTFEDQPLHKKAKEIIDKARAVFIPELVVIEFLTILLKE